MEVKKIMCSRTGCENEARKNPVITFTAKDAGPNAPRVQATLDLPVCLEHAIPDPKLFITGTGWRMIVEKFTRLRYAEPDRESVQIEFIDLPPHNPFEFLK